MDKEVEILDILTLKFKDQLLESEYQQHLSKTRRKFNIIMISIILAYSIVNNLLYSLRPFLQSEYEFLRNYSTITSYISSTVYLILLILSIIYTSLKVQRWISILAYYFLLYTNIVFQLYFMLSNHDTLIYSLIFALQHFFQLSWFYFGLITLYENIYVTVALCLSVVVYFGPFIPFEYDYGLSIHNIMFIVVGIFAYLYIMERKKGFYFNNKLCKVNKWYKHFLENINNGFLRIVNDKIIMINKAMIKTVFSSKDLSDLVNTDNIPLCDTENRRQYIMKSSELVLKKLIEELDFSENKYNEIIGLDNKLDVLKKFLEENIKNEEFTLIGMTQINEGDTIISYYEVFGRYYLMSNDYGVLDKNYSLMFNDVSDVKANAELQFKSIFLSKVAHEFKNPLLCIKELINQLLDQYNSVAEPAQDIFENIKCMSDYLIILIKDMDYISSKKTITLDKEKVNLDEMISFCVNITNTLIKKFHKEERVSLLVECTSMPRYLMTDEIKLKQILVNLLSNSVKFTMTGKITLKVEGQNESICFSVSDTGIGMSDEVVKNLFKPFIKTNIGNGIGTGLGLSIVKELVEAFNSNINIVSTRNGSDFAFTLNTDSDTQIISDLSVITRENEYHPRWNGLNYIENEAKNGHKITILVVDDDVMTRKSTVRLLTKYMNDNGVNIAIEEASDGLECLYIYYQSIIKGQQLSMIISDHTMNIMNGFTCAEVLYELIISRGYKQIPYIILTAYEVSCINNNKGVSEMFTKPLTNNSIKKILRHVL
jgi:signal transduction histidine kinase/CheY-like chemotaxis protein